MRLLIAYIFLVVPNLALATEAQFPNSPSSGSCRNFRIAALAMLDEAQAEYKSCLNGSACGDALQRRERAIAALKKVDECFEEAAQVPAMPTKKDPPNPVSQPSPKEDVALPVKSEEMAKRIEAARNERDVQQARQAELDKLNDERASQAARAAERRDALQLLKLAVECAENQNKEAITRNNWIGDETVFALASEKTEFVRNPEVGPNSPSWEIVGSEVVTTTEYFVHFSTIERARNTRDGLSLECKFQKPCISEIFSEVPGCSQVVSGGQICGNIGVSWKPKITVHSKISVGTICGRTLDDAGLAVAILSGGDNFTVAGTFRVSAKDSLNVRQEAGTNSAIVAAIAPESGPVNATSCKNVAGSKSRWCQVKWGQKQGWVSQNFLVPF